VKRKLDRLKATGSKNWEDQIKKKEEEEKIEQRKGSTFAGKERTARKNVM